MLSVKDSAIGTATAAVQTGLVSDPAAYQSLNQAASAGGAAGLDAAARAFEALLVGQMLKEMHTASLADGVFDSEQTRLYQDLYDQQAASVISEGEGLGIRKALLRQLAPELSEEVKERNPADLKLPERDPSLKIYKRQKADADASGSITSAVETDTAVAVKRTDAERRSGGSPTTQVQTEGRWPPRNAEEFVAYLKPYADQAAQTLGMDTSVLLAQSALETGWGKHVPRRADGGSSFNLFGIKADKSWQGDKVSVGTLEYRNGVAQREQAKFRAYDSPAESFVDYVAFLSRNPRYREALSSTNGEDFIRGLQKAGYATDPNYAAKILGIRDRMARLSGAAAETQVSSLPADSKTEG